MSEQKKSTDVAVKEDAIKDLAFPELTQQGLSQSLGQLIEIMPEHAPMLEVIKESLPEIVRASSLFYKTQSQFMDNTLTVSHLTPLRNLRQILAQMERVRQAIREHQFKLKKEELKQEEREDELEYVEAKLRELRASKSSNSLKKWLFGNIEVLPVSGKTSSADEAYEIRKLETKTRSLQVEIAEAKSNAETARNYISGAIRQLTNYTENYDSIKRTYNIGEFTEADFEAEEDRYHILKAFEQALCAARARHDRSIDEGNMIYLTQLGINGAHAQFRIREYLEGEDRMLRGTPASDVQPGIPPRAPTLVDYLQFLEQVYEEFKGSAAKFAKIRGLNITTHIALIQNGDTRLLQLNASKKDGK